MTKLMARIRTPRSWASARHRLELALLTLALASAVASVGLAVTSQDGHAAAGVESDSLRVPILVYHSIAPHHPGQTAEQRQLDVDPTVFEEQMRYLADHDYHVIPLDSLVTALKGSAAIPNRSVVITFDDGWLGQYSRAFPILRQFGFTATFFIFPHAIGRDELHMTWDQVREMQEAGMTIGSHSRTHPLLTNPQVSLPSEVDSSRRDIQLRLGIAPDLFAYPFGAWDARAVDAVRAAGYRAARGYPGGAWNKPADLFTLRSVLVTDDMQAFARTLGP